MLSSDSRNNQLHPLKTQFCQKKSLKCETVKNIEHSLAQVGNLIKIETVADGIIIYHKAPSEFSKNLRGLLKPFATFVDENNLPSSYLEIINSMTQERPFIAADDAEYAAMYANVIHLLVKKMKESENPLTPHKNN